MAITILLSAPGLVFGVLGVVDKIDQLDAGGSAASVYFLSALAAPYITPFAMVPMGVLVVGERGRRPLTKCAVALVALAAASTYLFSRWYRIPFM